MLRRIANIVIILLFVIYAVCPSYAANGNFYDTISQASDNEEGIYSDESNYDYSLLEAEETEDSDNPNEPTGNEPADGEGNGEGVNTEDGGEGGEGNTPTEPTEPVETDPVKIVCNEIMAVLSGQFGVSVVNVVSSVTPVSFTSTPTDPTPTDPTPTDPTPTDPTPTDPTPTDPTPTDPTPTDPTPTDPTPTDPTPTDPTPTDPTPTDPTPTDPTPTDPTPTDPTPTDPTPTEPTPVVPEVPDPFDVDPVNPSDGDQENASYREKLKQEFNIEVVDGTSSWDEKALKVAYETYKALPESYRSLAISLIRDKDVPENTNLPSDGTILGYVTDFERNVHILDAATKEVSAEEKERYKQRVIEATREKCINDYKEKNNGNAPSDEYVEQCMSHPQTQESINKIADEYPEMLYLANLTHTLVHETAHCLHNTYPTYYRQWQEKFWADGKAAEGCPTNYGKSSVAEDIAESISYYLQSSKERNEDGSVTYSDIYGNHTISKDRVDFIEKILKEIDDTYTANGKSHKA